MESSHPRRQPNPNVARIWVERSQSSIPHWIDEGAEHQERQYLERGRKYPFLLVSNHPHFRVHAQHDDAMWLREIETCKVTGPDGYKYEPVWVNPVDAGKLGLETGDVVKLYNERGAVLGGGLPHPRAGGLHRRGGPQHGPHRAVPGGAGGNPGPRRQARAMAAPWAHTEAPPSDGAGFCNRR